MQDAVTRDRGFLGEDPGGGDQQQPEPIFNPTMLLKGMMLTGQ
jgi:hypothetical protein